MYRLAVMADIHGNLPALEVVLDDIQRRGNPDAIWVLGDLVAFYPWLTETIDLLRSLPGVTCLQGNTDRYLVTGQRHTISVHSAEDWDCMPQYLTSRDEGYRWMVEQLRYEDYVFLRDLPDRIELALDGYSHILGVHAMPGNDEIRITPDTPNNIIPGYLDGWEGQLLLFGHTHIPMQRKLNGMLLVNPGSIGLSPDNEPCAVYALLEFSDRSHRVEFCQVKYEINQVIDQLQGSSYPGAQGLIQKLSR